MQHRAFIRSFHRENENSLGVLDRHHMPHLGVDNEIAVPTGNENETQFLSELNVSRQFPSP